MAIPWASALSSEAEVLGATVQIDHPLADLLLERTSELAPPAAAKLALDVADPVVTEREARHLPEHRTWGPSSSSRNSCSSSAHAAIRSSP